MTAFWSKSCFIWWLQQTTIKQFFQHQYKYLVDFFAFSSPIIFVTVSSHRHRSVLYLFPKQRCYLSVSFLNRNVFLVWKIAGFFTTSVVKRTQLMLFHLWEFVHVNYLFVAPYINYVPICCTFFVRYNWSSLTCITDWLLLF